MAVNIKTEIAFEPSLKEFLSNPVLPVSLQEIGDKAHVEFSKTSGNMLLPNVERFISDVKESFKSAMCEVQAIRLPHPEGKIKGETFTVANGGIMHYRNFGWHGRIDTYHEPAGWGYAMGLTKDKKSHELAYVHINSSSLSSRTLLISTLKLKNLKRLLGLTPQGKKPAPIEWITSAGQVKGPETLIEIYPKVPPLVNSFLVKKHGAYWRNDEKLSSAEVAFAGRFGNKRDYQGGDKDFYRGREGRWVFEHEGKRSTVVGRDLSFDQTVNPTIPKNLQGTIACRGIWIFPGENDKAAHSIFYGDMTNHFEPIQGSWIHQNS